MRGSAAAVAQKPNLQLHERDRLIAWLESHCTIDPDRGCWLWTGGTGGKGYGVICVSRRNRYVHRLAAHLYLGFDLASPLLVLHRCDTPACLFPEHLFWGTHADNIHDCMAKGRFNATGRANGERVNTAKLTPDDVRAIRVLAAAGESFVAIARRYPISNVQVKNIVRRISWKHNED
jgi:hypothetical protein